MVKQSEYYPVALTVAGSDSGGGAGIQADLRTFSAFGVYGCSVLTAVTAQNPREVRQVEVLTPGIVKTQLKAVLELMPIKAIKTGMLASSGIVNAVGEVLAKQKLPLVVDPVMVSTSGVRLLDSTAETDLRDNLLELASWVTPNISEAEILTGSTVSTPEELAEAVKNGSQNWNCGFIVTVGDMPAKNEKLSTDFVGYQGKVYELISPRVGLDSGVDNHGSGCTFSSAVAAALALGMPWKKALASAKAFVYGSLLEKVPLGKKLEGMYPPLESYLDKVTLKRYC